MTLRHPGCPGTVAVAFVDNAVELAIGNHLEILRHPGPQHPDNPLAVFLNGGEITRPDIGDVVTICGNGGRRCGCKCQQNNEQIKDRYDNCSSHASSPFEIACQLSLLGRYSRVIS